MISWENIQNMWRFPKTNWENSDFFNVAPDWVRITDNIRYIQSLARPYYLEIDLEEMDSLTESDFFYARRLNSVENNVEILGNSILNLNTYPQKEVQQKNAPFWDYADLNRIEKFILQLKTIVEKTAPNQMTLAFTLGAEEYE